MKKTTIGLIWFLGIGLLAHGQAPQSLAGFTMYANSSRTNILVINDQKVVDFFADGTFTVRVVVGDILPAQPNSYVYGPPFSGTYQYRVTSPTTALLDLTPLTFNPQLDLVTFYNSTLGTIASEVNPGPAAEKVLFYLAPTGGTSSQRALVNLSTLLNAKRGETTTTGFVIAGSRAPGVGEQPADYREVLIRAPAR